MGNILGFSTSTLLVIVVPLACVMLAFWFLIWEAQKKSRRPFSGRPLRPPGESVRLKVDALNEQLLFRLMTISVVLIPASLVADLALKRGDLATGTTVMAVGTALVLGIVLWAWRTAKELRNYSLGFDGERAVGEELNRLMLDGCQVFHDLPLEALGNVDHVVVAPHAVFAVETKAKRKRRPAAAGQETHKVIFNGRELIYPQGTDRDALDQVRRNAQALAEKLSRLTAGPVVVRPVLVLPGWWVERTGKSEVTVVNDKASQLRGAMLDAKGTPLEAKQRQRIVELLEDWSRQSMEK